ncbi:MAG: DUF4097 family beta strand repeat-containing protein [bacterium]
MYPVRRLEALLPAAAILLTSCALRSAEEQTEQTVKVEPGTGVHLETRNGRIEVHAGRVGKVKIKALKKARATSNPQGMLKDITMVVKKKAGVLRITAEHPSGSLTKQYGVSFEVWVPPGTPVTLETRNGSVRLVNLTGSLTASTRNGSIKTENTPGPFKLSTRNGAIQIRGAAKAFDVRSRNGSIRIALADGVTRLGDCVAETHNGSVRLIAPPGFAADVDAKTRNGSIKSDFSLKKSGRARAAGQVGSGGGKLRLQTRNGSIRIHKR